MNPQTIAKRLDPAGAGQLGLADALIDRGVGERDGWLEKIAARVDWAFERLCGDLNAAPTRRRFLAPIPNIAYTSVDVCGPWGRLSDGVRFGARKTKRTRAVGLDQ